jgi:hypothetical protein
MAELILEHSTHVTSPEGTRFTARTYGEERSDGTWAGWIEFTPEDGSGPVLLTDQETSQPNRVTLEYWATGLEPIYFEGAFERAQLLNKK